MTRCVENRDGDHPAAQQRGDAVSKNQEAEGKKLLRHAESRNGETDRFGFARIKPIQQWL